MRKLRLLVLSLVLAAAALLPAAPAQAFCSPEEGCSPCPGPELVIEGKNTRIVWYAC